MKLTGEFNIVFTVIVNIVNVAEIIHIMQTKIWSNIGRLSELLVLDRKSVKETACRI